MRKKRKGAGWGKGVGWGKGARAAQKAKARAVREAKMLVRRGRQRYKGAARGGGGESTFAIGAFRGERKYLRRFRPPRASISGGGNGGAVKKGMERSFEEILSEVVLTQFSFQFSFLSVCFGRI